MKGPDLPACKWCGSLIPKRPIGHAGRGRLYCGDDCRSAANNATKSAKVQSQRRCPCGALPKNRRGTPVCLECFERRAAYLSRRRTLAPYGLTPEGYDDLLDHQGSRCAICATSDPGGAYFVVDHDHATGAVRGLLCVKCNTGLGMFGDDIASLLNAAKYLQRPRGTPP